MKTYAGIGSRETPQRILSTMTGIAMTLWNNGWVLRSGAALGADSAFESGANNNAEIYLPWPGYNEHQSSLCSPSLDAIIMAGTYHPAWDRCSQGARKLHGRNCHIVLGSDLNDPVDIIVCWTPGGKRKGGTGQALRMIRDYPDIEVFDLAIEKTSERLWAYISK